jgi:diguanylate cyclase (GGDEF)-like protein/PAS domain S-box-containing protein
MKAGKPKSGDVVNNTTLRQRAETQLARQQARPPHDDEGNDRSLHELQVHQIELEMQNEALLQAQAELRESLEHYQELSERLAMRESELNAIIETEPECVKQIAEDGRLLHMNPAGLAMIEAESIEQVRGQQVVQLVEPEHQAAFLALTKDVFAGKSGQLEFPVIGLKGGRRWLETHGTPLRNSQGKVIALLGITRDITERKQLQDQMRQLAYLDSLTQLPNRRLLNDRLNQAMATSKRSGAYGALLFLDLDNFKPLNDLHGHDVGDLLLIEVATRLKGSIREMDTVARFGGDEFVVILGELTTDKAASKAQARLVAEKIRCTLAAPYRLTIKCKGKKDVHIEHSCTASIGVTLFLNHDASDSDILKWADMAMYEAKENGGNLIRFRE